MEIGRGEESELGGREVEKRISKRIPSLINLHSLSTLHFNQSPSISPANQSTIENPLLAVYGRTISHHQK